MGHKLCCDRFDDREQGNVFVASEVPTSEGTHAHNNPVKMQTYFKFIEQCRLEYESKQNCCDSFVPDDVLPVPISELIESDVLIRVTLVLAAHIIPRREWYLEFDAAETIQRLLEDGESIDPPVSKGSYGGCFGVYQLYQRHGHSASPRTGDDVYGSGRNYLCCI